MCGIYGMLFHSNQHNTAPYRARMLFSALAERAVTRGRDAAGLAVVNPNNEIALYKNAVASTEIIKFRRWWRELRKIGSGTYAVMGHTRFGTHGENIIANAHPFRFGNLVGTHNGVISNYRAFGPEKPFECDSANLLYGLSKTPREQWKDLLETVEGSFALAFSDEAGFYFVRNSSSPCTMAYIRDLDVTVYASTDTILEQAAKDCDLTLERKEDFPTDILRTYSYNGAGVTDEKINLKSRNTVTYSSRGSSVQYSNWDEEEGGFWPGMQKSLPLANPHSSWTQAEPYKCLRCDQNLSGKRYWDTGVNGLSCPECYEKGMEEEVFSMQDEDSHPGVCDLCRTEDVVYALGITGQACGSCMRDFDKDTPVNEDDLKVYCEACGEEFIMNPDNPPKDLLFIPHWDVYMCVDCNEKYAQLQH